VDAEGRNLFERMVGGELQEYSEAETRVIDMGLARFGVVGAKKKPLILSSPLATATVELSLGSSCAIGRAGIVVRASPLQVGEGGGGEGEGGGMGERASEARTKERRRLLVLPLAFVAPASRARGERRGEHGTKQQRAKRARKEKFVGAAASSFCARFARHGRTTNESKPRRYWRPSGTSTRGQG
jgi:hypothetical protein